MRHHMRQKIIKKLVEQKLVKLCLYNKNDKKRRRHINYMLIT